MKPSKRVRTGKPQQSQSARRKRLLLAWVLFLLTSRLDGGLVDQLHGCETNSKRCEVLQLVLYTKRTAAIAARLSPLQRLWRFLNSGAFSITEENVYLFITEDIGHGGAFSVAKSLMVALSFLQYVSGATLEHIVSKPASLRLEGLAASRVAQPGP